MITPRNLRAEVAAALICLGLGLLLSSLPHWVAWARTGETAWIADLDELYYLGVGSKAYRHHPTSLSDPIRPEGGTALYRWLPLGPGVLAAKALELGPLGINVAWRILGGAAVGLTWYLLARQYARGAWIGAALAVLLVTDVGLLEFRPFLRNLTLLADVLLGRDAALYASTKPLVHPNWRLASPTLTAPFLLLHLWLYARARREPTPARLLGSGIGFGLLFHVYFYYWVAAGLALVLALVFDGGRRKVAAATILLGGLIGLPVVIADAILKATTSRDWLLRSDKFVPIGHFAELHFPKLVLILMALSLPVVARWRRDLLQPWLLGAAGMLLYNHQLVTGLQLENTHWALVIEPCAALVTLVLAWSGLERAMQSRQIRGASLLLGSAAVLAAANGLALRALEADRTQKVAEIADLRERYEAQRFAPDAAPLAANSVIVADSVVAELAAILEDQRPLNNYWAHLSPSVDDREWDERNALDGYLAGHDRASFEAAHRSQLESLRWGELSRDRAVLEARLAGRVAAFEAIAANPGPALDRYRVRYVLRPADRPAPAPLVEAFERLQHGPSWDVWERRAARPRAEAIAAQDR